jgi:hypothetical protein
MIGERSIESRDKEKRERYSGYSAVKYASIQRERRFFVAVEPIMK